MICGVSSVVEEFQRAMGNVHLNIYILSVCHKPGEAVGTGDV